MCFFPDAFGPLAIAVMAIVVVAIVKGLAGSPRQGSDNSGLVLSPPTAPDEQERPTDGEDSEDRVSGFSEAEAGAEKWLCPTAKCRAENPAHARFCRRCGKKRG